MFTAFSFQQLKTKAHNSQVCCAFENALQMQPRAEKGPGGHYWICFEGTLPHFNQETIPFRPSQRKETTARSHSLNVISKNCASKQIEIDPGEISHKVAISVQPNKLKQYWRYIAQSG